MPEDLDDARTGASTLYFADDLPDLEFQLLEAVVYDAEEVRDITGDDNPQFGRWLSVAVGDDDECWLVAVGELIQELQHANASAGDRYKVTRCEKSGADETDPYEVNLEDLNKFKDQQSLDSAGETTA